MPGNKILGIDTSNYTTSVALYGDGEVVQKKKLLPVKPGELGLRQSDAVFHHTQQLPPLMEELMEPISDKIEAIGVSVRPRDQEGSYMPCFTVGASSQPYTGRSPSYSVIYLFSSGRAYCGCIVFRRKTLLAERRKPFSGVSCFWRDHRSPVGHTQKRKVANRTGCPFFGFKGGTGCGSCGRNAGTPLSFRKISGRIGSAIKGTVFHTSVHEGGQLFSFRCRKSVRGPYQKRNIERRCSPVLPAVCRSGPYSDGGSSSEGKSRLPHIVCGRRHE